MEYSLVIFITSYILYLKLYREEVGWEGMVTAYMNSTLGDLFNCYPILSDNGYGIIILMYFGALNLLL